MVDPIGPKGSTPTDLRIAPVAAVVAAPKAASVATPQVSAESTAGQLASQLAAAPPVDTDRVARIKAAIAAGTFPILPATVADRLLALHYDWTQNDSA